MKPRLKVVLVAATALAVTAGFQNPSLSQSQPKAQAQVKHGPYYRIKADFTYKTEPVQFNVVVGCNALVTPHFDRDRSVEVGIAPMVYGLEMKDGGALAMVTPAICDQGLNAVKADFRPFMMTFPDAKAPWEGLGYVTNDAYESPMSTLKFMAASIIPATEAEYKEWRQAEADKNIVKPHMLAQNLYRPFEPNVWHPGKRYFPHECEAASYWEIYGDKKALTGWDPSKPTYWEPGLWPVDRIEEAVKPVNSTININRYGSFMGDLYTIGTDPTKNVEVYPVNKPRNMNNIELKKEINKSVNGKQIPFVGKIDDRPIMRGFAYCQPTTGNEKYPDYFLSTKDSRGRRLNVLKFGDDINMYTDVYYEIGNDRVHLKFAGIAFLNGVRIGLKNEKMIKTGFTSFLSISGGL